MVQIIGKGGFAREVAGQSFTKFTMVESGELKYTSQLSIPTVIAIGDGTVRKAIFSEFPDLNYTLFFKGNEYGNNTYGKGSIICPGTIITTNVNIGDFVIINLNCTVGHDSKIGDFTTISPGVNISGNVNIGKLCYIGSNAVIREKINICDNVVIGAGSVVVKDIQEPGVYVGNPVKKIK